MCIRDSYYIYAVHFLESGYVVGCRYNEIVAADDVFFDDADDEENAEN